MNYVVVNNKKYRATQVDLMAYYDLKDRGVVWTKAFPAKTEIAERLLEFYPELSEYTPRRRVREHGIALLEAGVKPRYYRQNNPKFVYRP